MVEIDDIRRAAERIDGLVRRTPTVRPPPLRVARPFDVWAKLESLQVTGSFKPRGAVNKLLSLERRDVAPFEREELVDRTPRLERARHLQGFELRPHVERTRDPERRGAHGRRPPYEAVDPLRSAPDVVDLYHGLLLRDRML